jgi:PAS domain S-box-containing protein
LDCISVLVCRSFAEGAKDERMNDETIRVLSIEDSPADAMLIQERLANAQRIGWDLPRFEIKHVNCLAAALKQLSATAQEGGDGVDVVLSDLDLPDSQADETVAALREHIPNRPLVVLTGREDEALARKSVRAGVQDYLYKKEATGSLLARTMMNAVERQKSKQALQEAHDVLERRVEERTAELTKTSERVTNVLESISDGFIAMDQDLVVTYFNAAAERLLGREREEVIGRNLFEAFPEARGSIFEEKYTEAVRERTSVAFETYFGEEPYENWYDVKVRPYEDGITAYFRVITERKKREMKQKRTIRELRIITDAITEASRIEDVDEMCELIGETIHEANEDAYVIVSLYDRGLDAIRVRAMAGTDRTFDRALKRFGEDLSGLLTVRLSEMDGETRPYVPGELACVAGGLHTLLGGKAPRDACREIEDMANIGSVYTVGFDLEGKSYGGIAILLPEGDAIKYGRAVETLASHFSVVMRRRQAEEALRKSEDWLSTTLRSIGDGVIATDDRGCVRLMNPVAEALTRWDENEAIGEPLGEVFDIVNEQTGERAENPVERVFREGAIVGLANHTVLVAKDGTRCSIADSAAPIRGEDGNIRGAILVFRDVTEERRAEERLTFQSMLLDQIQDMVTATDLEGRITYVNEAECRAFGKTSEELIGQHVAEYGEVPERGATQQEILDSTLTEGRWRGEVINVIEDGREITLDCRTWLVHNEHGEPVGMVGISTDISERKEIEGQVKRYAAELERSNRELEQFGYVISHDLRTPLRRVRSYLDLLEERCGDQLDARASKYVDRAVEGIGRMEAMIGGLLDLSRVETQGRAFAPTDVEMILEDTLRLLGPEVEESGAEVTQDPLPIIMADRAQLAQVFQNLIANAIKFRREGIPPRIHIAAEREGDEWVFSVVDNGIGIDPEQVERIFQIFQRLHTEEEYEGMGIGLALCRRIVERHGGRIWVESEIGEGSTFTFTLPA